MLINKLSNNNQIIHFWRVGVIVDDDDKEFVIDRDYLYIELDNGYIKIKSEQGDSKLKVTTCLKRDYKNEDEICCCKLDYLIFNMPEMDYKLCSIFAKNYFITENEICSDSLLLELKVGDFYEKIYICTGIFGILVKNVSLDTKVGAMEKII